MLAVVAPLLHSKDPVKLVAVKSELPSQLSTTPTVGAAGIALTVNNAALLFAGAQLPLVNTAR